MKTSLFPSRRCAVFAAVAAVLPCAFAQNSHTLPPMTVIATRFAEPAQPLPFGVTVISADEIRASGAATVNEALMRVAGVVGRQDFFGAGEYSLDLRGFGATADTNQVVVVDGLRVSESDLGGTRLSGIPIESVERIEILRGSGAVLYGEGATGGVIIITTRAGAGRDRRNAASVYVGAGSFGLREGRGTATLATGPFSLDVSVQKRDADNHRDNFASRTDAASITAQWYGDWLRVGARASQDSLDTGLPGALTAAQYAVNPGQSTAPNDSGSIRNERASVFVHAETGNWRLAVDAGQRDKRLRSMNSGFAYDYDVSATAFNLNARNESRFGGGTNVLVLGASHDKWQRDVLGAFGSTATQSSRALFARDDFTMAGGTRIAVGARTEKIAKENTNSASGTSNRMHAWEFGVSHPVHPGVTAYGRVGRSYRLANVDEFSFTSPGAVLRPQVSRDMELGTRWAQGAGSVDARLYRSELENEIGFNPAAPGAFFPGANVNFDRTRRQGLEVDASYAVTSAFGLRLNAAVRDATFLDGPYPGKDVPLTPRHTVAIRADWKPAAGHRVTGGVNWVSSQHPDFNNACKMPAYATVDARYAFQTKAVELSLGVTNMLDRKYYTQAFGCAAGVTTSIYPDAGRAFVASVRASF